MSDEGTAGERAGQAYAEPAARPTATQRALLEAFGPDRLGAVPAGRSRRRGVRRVRRDVTLDPELDALVVDVAERVYGGNYSAAACALLRLGVLEYRGPA